jgi:hypothetical protein
LHHPDAKGVTSVTGSIVVSNLSPGAINPPIIFEPTQQLAPGHNLCFIVSGFDPNYGGCAIIASLDGGISYGTSPIGTCGAGSTGTVVNEYPAGVDPDITDELLVSMSESGKPLPNVSQAEADGDQNLCYLGSSSGYEIISPGNVITGSNSQYASTYVRRGAEGTTSYSHPAGDRLGAIDRAAAFVSIPVSWYGKTLYFKFAAFNKTGGQQQSLANCTPYEFTLPSLTPPAPTITAQLIGIPGGLQFSFEMAGDLNIEQYWIYRGTTNVFATAVRWLPYPSPTTPQPTTISDVGMQGGASYYYWVVAVSIDGISGPPAAAQAGEVLALSPIITEYDELTTSLGIPIVTQEMNNVIVEGIPIPQ